MSREIKFRAYTRGMGMAPPITLSEITNDGYFGVYGIEENDPIMQYTGLKDSAGVEIYEGDICKWFINEHEVKGEVYYEAQGFDMRCPERGLICWDSNRGEVLVIGNIHENPELLHQKGEGL